MAVELYLLRHPHGRHQNGTKERFYVADKDISLSDIGNQQADEAVTFLKCQLKGRSPIIVTTEFRRTQQLAERIADACQSNDIQIVPFFNEWQQGLGGYIKKLRDWNYCCQRLNAVWPMDQKLIRQIVEARNGFKRDKTKNYINPVAALITPMPLGRSLYQTFATVWQGYQYVSRLAVCDPERPIVICGHGASGKLFDHAMRHGSQNAKTMAPLFWQTGYPKNCATKKMQCFIDNETLLLRIDENQTTAPEDQFIPSTKVTPHDEYSPTRDDLDSLIDMFVANKIDWVAPKGWISSHNLSLKF